jgi:DNA-binding transcriptional regulator GbsR (MarR family)
LTTEKVLQNGGEIQDGRQTRMSHNSVSVHLNHLKTSDLETSIHKKQWRRSYFFQKFKMAE